MQLNIVKLGLLKNIIGSWNQQLGIENSESFNLIQNLDIHEKLLTFFQKGDFYYFIFSPINRKFDFISKDVKRIIGYFSHQLNYDIALSLIHPEDRPYYRLHIKKTIMFLSALNPKDIYNYKIRFDLRVRVKDDSYIRIMQEVIPVQTDPNGIITKIFGVHTDITDIKPTGIPTLSFIGLNGKQTFIDVKLFDDEFELAVDRLTDREREIFYLIINAKSTQEIGKLLGIANETVSTHRKRILKKLGFSSTVNLITTIKNGFK